MKIRTAALLVPVLLALCVGTAVAKPASGRAQVDQHFGTHGSTVIAAPAEGLPGPIGFAVAPSNKSYALDGAWVLAFGANSKPDKGFAGTGRLRLVPGPGNLLGGTSLAKLGATDIGGLAVDAKGRAVVAFGSTRPEVARLLPNGSLDTGFAKGAVVRAEVDKNAATSPAAVAIDSKGRILVAGSAQSRSLKTGTGVAITPFIPGN